MTSPATHDKGFFRRKFPRRAYSRLVGALVGGKYSMFMASEIGEGGMSIYGDASIHEGQQLVLTFQIPGGNFVSVRCSIRSNRNKEGRLTNGLSFENLEFAHKRQIRAFVSSRSSEEEVT